MKVPGSKFSMTAAWCSRPESVDECADRLFRFLDGIAKCDLAFQIGTSRQDGATLAVGTTP